MNSLKLSNNDWITSQQELLLKASILHGDDAIQSWEKWKSSIDFDHIDPGSYRLLPLLYSNIIKYEIKDPLINRIKGIYRRTWCENQILTNQAIKLLKLFHSEGIETIVLKGIAMTVLYYKDYGLRPMSDFDILIPTKKAPEAIRLLRKSGWKPGYKSPEHIISFIHSCDMCDISGLYHLDLHWHLLIECCQANADDDFWEGALQVNIKDNYTYVLNPADQLLHTCIHGMKWSIIPPFRWVADAMMILNSSQTEIDWNRLISQAKKRRLILPLQKAIDYLFNNLNAGIPENIFETIQKITVTTQEYLEFKFKISNQKRKLLGNIPVLWFDSLRLSENMPPIHKLTGFVNYLKHFWDLESIWELILYVKQLSIKKVRSIK